MEIKEILALEDENKKITELKKRIVDPPDVTVIKKQIDPSQHDIFDEIIRPDKNITKTLPDKTEVQDVEYVARIALPFQQLIVNRHVAFTFANRMKYICKPKGKEKEVFNCIKEVIKGTKLHPFNSCVARSLYTYKECAEYWYTVPKDEDEENLYGINADRKLKVVLFTPENGDELFPLFDDQRDLIAFSRGYVKKIDKKDINYFETWTKDTYLLWKQDGRKWIPQNVKDDIHGNVIEVGKIPIVYIRQTYSEWECVQVLIDRLEELLSNFADANDYHAWPKIFIQGKVIGFASKGETGAIIEGSTGSTAQYLYWPDAPDSIKLEITTLINLIYTLTQTPDISWESVKGLGNMSGVALELLFMDAHLKVMAKTEYWNDFMSRRMSLIKRFISKLNTEQSFVAATKSIEIDSQIVPYIINDKKSLVDMLVAATAGKAVVSQEAATQIADLSEDSEEDFKKITAEEDRNSLVTISEPTVV